ncbi:MAG: bis(5'-nucleosyl)-tetraphosphatase (symmetrical) YqeK [Bacillota bacterium]|nr:bis(5'-nucleosyl)-tetraphosphatase (symmetrical) YqeK [Bacillota bacterium]
MSFCENAEETVRRAVESRLSEKRKRHTEGVIEAALALSQRYGEDLEKARLAALCHDLCKDLGREETDRLVREWGLDSRYIGNPDLAHGPLAACLAENELGIEDPDVLNAIRYHTTGRKGMSRLEKIIYLADGIEPSRHYPGVETLRRLAEEDLDAACLAMLRRTVKYVKDRGRPLDPHTLEAKDALEREGEPERRES